MLPSAPRFFGAVGVKFVRDNVNYSANFGSYRSLSLGSGSRQAVRPLYTRKRAAGTPDQFGRRFSLGKEQSGRQCHWQGDLLASSVLSGGYKFTRRSEFQIKSLGYGLASHVSSMDIQALTQIRIVRTGSLPSLIREG